MPGRDGKPVQLSALKGKVVLLDFWATWCAGCKVEIPWFIEFDKAYRSKGLAAIGVSMDDEGWKTIEPYLKKNPISYTDRGRQLRRRRARTTSRRCRSPC